MGTISPVIPLDIERQAFNGPVCILAKTKRMWDSLGGRHVKSKGQNLCLFFYIMHLRESTANQSQVFISPDPDLHLTLIFTQRLKETRRC